MNPLKSKNIVAKILQVYAYLNAVAGIIIAIFIANEFDGAVAVVVFAVILVTSFFIYAIGEIIELLHQIKVNTSGKATNSEDDELPDL